MALTSVYIGWQPLEVVRSPALRHLYGTLYRTTSKTLPFRCLILRSRLRLFCFPDTNYSTSSAPEVVDDGALYKFTLYLLTYFTYLVLMCWPCWHDWVLHAGNVFTVCYVKIDVLVWWQEGSLACNTFAPAITEGSLRDLDGSGPVLVWNDLSKILLTEQKPILVVVVVVVVVVSVRWQ